MYVFFYRQTEMGLPLCPKQSFNNSSPVVRSNQQRLVYAGKPHQRRRGGGCFGRQHRCEPGNVGTHHVQRIFQLTLRQTYLRVELQTLTRLPRTQAVLFSFKTYLYGIRQIREQGSGPELADAIEGLKSGNAPGMWRYKSAVRWGKPVCDYLRS